METVHCLHVLSRGVGDIVPAWAVTGLGFGMRLGDGRCRGPHNGMDEVAGEEVRVIPGFCCERVIGRWRGEAGMKGRMLSGKGIGIGIHHSIGDGDLFGAGINRRRRRGGCRPRRRRPFSARLRSTSQRGGWTLLRQCEVRDVVRRAEHATRGIRTGG